MSIEAANKSRFERGKMKLTEMDGEVLEVLEEIVEEHDVSMKNYRDPPHIEKARVLIKRAYGHD